MEGDDLWFCGCEFEFVGFVGFYCCYLCCYCFYDVILEVEEFDCDGVGFVGFVVVLDYVC